MKRIVVAFCLVLALSSPAAAPKRGKERLRELAVLPNLVVNYNFDFELSDSSLTQVLEETSPTARIAQLRQELKRQPDDIQRQMQLGRALEDISDTNASQVCYEKAVQISRQEVQARPQDGLALANLGDALFALDKVDEAERVYRKAILISSNEWKCWAGLGKCLDGRSSSLLAPSRPHTQINPSMISTLQEMLDSHPPAEALSKSQELQNEASKCFDRAVALAPKEPDALLQRAGDKCQSQMEDCLIRHFRNEQEVNTSQLSLSYYSKAAVPDIQKAAQLSPKACKLIGAAAWFEWGACVGPRALQGSPAKPTFDTLPVATQQSILTAITRLENLGQDPDKKLAAASLETLAFLRMLLSMETLEPRASKRDLRRALALDPSREQSWELLLVLVAQSESPAELVKVCESRLKSKETARNHLLLAKALARQENWAKANEQAEAALKTEPTNIVAQLMLGAVAIRQSTDRDSLALATEHLSPVLELLKKEPPSEEKSKRAREFALNAAIVAGLADEPSQARDFVERVLRENPNDETAKEILRALE